MRMAAGVALSVHALIISMTSVPGAPQLALIRPLQAAEIAVDLEAPGTGAPAEEGIGSPEAEAAPEEPRAAPRPEPVPSVPKPRARVAAAAAVPAPAPPEVPREAVPPPSSPPAGAVSVPSNSRARQSGAFTGTGPGRGGGRGGLFGGGRSVGNEPGALEARVCWIPQTTRSVEELGPCEPVHREFLDVIDVPSRRFEEGFPGLSGRTEWFSVTISGAFTVSKPGLYRFRLQSDDGSQLFIDHHLVVDNDGIHDAISKRGEIELDPGRHRIVVKYFQGMKYMLALQLFVTPPGQPERLFSTRL